MHTLEQLRSGALQGSKRLQISEELTSFPDEIYDLADSLEVLDLSNNRLRDLPSDLTRLTQLKIFFASNNLFEHLPDVLGQMPRLEMIGFKHNRIERVSEHCLPEQTRWLILTDNRITALPENIGKLTRLEKLALAGNQISVLPDSFAQLKNLGLLRLSANALAEFPDLLLALPKLAWLAFSGNPFCPAHDEHADFMQVHSQDMTLHEVLGMGASGLISRGTWRNNEHGFADEVAVKVFKGEVTSDGFPKDELDACLTLGHHDNLVKPLAHIHEPDCAALVMGLIPGDYYNLGQPPSLETCTRDTFTQGQSFTARQAEHIIAQMRELIAYFESKAVSHGDLYAHNVLINAAGHILFGDFGAASKYHNLTPAQQAGVQTIERRALAYFEEDVRGLVNA
ncbi:leucine-rich repeat-containing protein kinase family protein [Marinobacterium mangrovicola]|uniref:Leucine rich repeat (LRR) protein n=1 Tax=Marinobacterium mangrovicola TaxID=1476959 RepID=A0A4V2PE32_9GAMM|nr:leucine-rich repeat-containing protein kinase family protein [Marinobacterium mangrovicola]TCK07466.1 leucine rich repeat (LRR) protein [Marinobacterium mangrovicola]